MVLSDILQVSYELVSVFAPHFSSCEIESLQGLGKIVMTKQTILKAYNEFGHGLFVSS